MLILFLSTPTPLPVTLNIAVGLGITRFLTIESEASDICDIELIGKSGELLPRLFEGIPLGTG